MTALEKMYTIEGLGELFPDICKQKWYRLIAEEKLPRVKLDGRVLIPESAVLALLREGPEAKDQTRAARMREVGLRNKKVTQ